MAKVTYTVDHSGGTIGKSGAKIRYTKGVPLECEDGELDHLGNHAAKEKKKAASKPSGGGGQTKKAEASKDGDII